MDDAQRLLREGAASSSAADSAPSKPPFGFEPKVAALVALLPVFAFLADAAVFTMLLSAPAIFNIWAFALLLVMTLYFRFVTLFAALAPRADLLLFVYIPCLLMPFFTKIMAHVDVLELYDAASEVAPRPDFEMGDPPASGPTRASSASSGTDSAASTTTKPRKQSATEAELRVTTETTARHGFQLGWLRAMLHDRFEAYKAFQIGPHASLSGRVYFAVRLEVMSTRCQQCST